MRSKNGNRRAVEKYLKRYGGSKSQMKVCSSPHHSSTTPTNLSEIGPKGISPLTLNLSYQQRMKERQNINKLAKERGEARRVEPYILPVVAGIICPRGANNTHSRSSSKEANAFINANISMQDPNNEGQSTDRRSQDAQNTTSREGNSSFMDTTISSKRLKYFYYDNAQKIYGNKTPPLIKVDRMMKIYQKERLGKNVNVNMNMNMNVHMNMNLCNSYNLPEITKGGGRGDLSPRGVRAKNIYTKDPLTATPTSNKHPPISSNISSNLSTQRKVNKYGLYRNNPIKLKDKTGISILDQEIKVFQPPNTLVQPTLREGGETAMETVEGEKIGQHSTTLSLGGHLGTRGSNIVRNSHIDKMIRRIYIDCKTYVPPSTISNKGINNSKYQKVQKPTIQ